MIFRALLISALLAWSGFSATYYVSTTGNDTNPGTELSPWLTVQHGVDVAQAGDTVLIQPGYYQEDPDTVRGGTSDTNRITIRGLRTGGQWAQVSSFGIGHPYITLDSISSTGRTAIVLINIGKLASYARVQNCYIYDWPSGDYGLFWSADGQGIHQDTEAACHVVVSNNVFRNGGHAFMEMFGTNNLAINNYFDDSNARDFFHPMGAWNTWRGNTFTNCNYEPSADGLVTGDHPDCFQIMVVGSSQPVRASMYNVIEGNLFINNLAALHQSNSGLNHEQVTNIHSIYFRNNLIIRSAQMASIGIPRFYALNNTFVSCTTNNNTSVLTWSYYGPTDGADRASAVDGLCANNIFYDCGGVSGAGWGVQAASTSWSTNGGIPALNLVRSNNFASGVGSNPFAAKSSTFTTQNANSVNGGDPKFAHPDTGLFKLAAGSVLIDRGVTLAGVPNDYEGNARPLGGAYDIGAFERDPALLVHLDFDRGFTNAGYVLDVTGNGYNGMRFNTNWIVPTNGAFGSMAARFETNFWSTNGVNRYEGSQYLAITNIPGTRLASLTNMTVSFWSESWGKSQQPTTYLIDAATRGTPVSQYTNTWRIGRVNIADIAQMQLRVYKATTTSTDGDVVARWPNNATSIGRSTNGLEHYVVTVDLQNDRAVAYLNGRPTYTNATTIVFPTLDVGPGAPTDWISIGAHKYNEEGTYTWETTGDADGDGFPNDAYHNGLLDDVRIYERVLSADEVSALYAGSGGATVASVPPPIGDPEPTNSPPVITAQPVSQTVYAGQTATFTVAATGQDLTYDWYAGAEPVGIQGTTLTINNAQLSDAGDYQVRVSNVGGFVWSDTVTLTVLDLPGDAIPSAVSGEGTITGNGRIW
jgi:hypothetical protein